MVGTPAPRSLACYGLRCACRQRFTPPTLQTTSNSGVNGTLPPPKHNFIAELSKWENALKPLWINQAKQDILESHNGKPPKVLDPFGGGGSIPLEAQRLGCETYSCDLNSVAVLIQKCTLEFPQKYGQCLHDNVKKYGDQILVQVEEELAQFYPNEPDGSDIFAYIWARTLPCQNFNCNAIIPLVKQFWLAKNAKKKIALFPYGKNGQIAFRIVGTAHEKMPHDFDPGEGTVTNGRVTCPLCGSTIPSGEKQALFQEGAAGERLISVVLRHRDVPGKQYRLVTDGDVEIFNKAQRWLSEKRAFLKEEWGFDPVPDEPTPKVKGQGAERAIAIHDYNLNTYGSLFNARQQLALITLTEKIRNAHSEMITRGYETDYARAVSTYLGLWLNQIVDNSSNLCTWTNTSETLGHVFGRAAQPMVWDYAEANSLRKAEDRLKTLLKPIRHLVQMHEEPNAIQQASATQLPYLDNTFDAVLTDPPYYDNVPYAYLSDFFYVWFKRSIGELYPELFEELMTPKNEEIVAYGHRDGGVKAGKQLFEEGLSKAFKEMHRVLKPDGIAVIVYAHKSTEGWETLINALLDSGLVVTAAWPIDTEMKSRLRAMNSAALGSSIYVVARKMERETFGLYQDVKRELEAYLEQKLFTLWEWGFSGADLFIAAIGLGIEIFGKYEEVIDEDDNVIRADRMIADIREILECFDGEQTGIGGTQLTRFYLRWRREYGEKSVIFNDARELALSLGIELTEEWNESSFIQQEKTNVRVLPPQEREGHDVSDSEELIDILHHVLLLWRAGNRTEMIQHLSKDGVGSNELIWSVAQQIGEALPADNQEHQWLEGWLADRAAIQREVAEILENPQQEI
jgi:adenine-specific DNA methylase